MTSIGALLAKEAEKTKKQQFDEILEKQIRPRIQTAIADCKGIIPKGIKIEVKDLYKNLHYPDVWREFAYLCECAEIHVGKAMHSDGTCEIVKLGGSKPVSYESDF